MAAYKMSNFAQMQQHHTTGDGGANENASRFSLSPLANRTAAGATHHQLTTAALRSLSPWIAWSYSGVSADHLSFQLYTHVMAFRSARVKRVRFFGMRLGEIPFFVEPMEERMQLKAGQKIRRHPRSR